jgi:hypothetical protein
MSECQEITGKAGTGGCELARALAGAEVPAAYAAALEAGGCGWDVLVRVWATAEAASVGDGEETGAKIRRNGASKEFLYTVLPVTLVEGKSV